MFAPRSASARLSFPIVPGRSSSRKANSLVVGMFVFLLHINVPGTQRAFLRNRNSPISTCQLPTSYVRPPSSRAAVASPMAFISLPGCRPPGLRWSASGRRYTRRSSGRGKIRCARSRGHRRGGPRSGVEGRKPPLRRGNRRIWRPGQGRKRVREAGTEKVSRFSNDFTSHVEKGPGLALESQGFRHKGAFLDQDGSCFDCICHWRLLYSGGPPPPVGFRRPPQQRAKKYCGHAPCPAGSLPDGFLGALQFRHLPDAQNQRVAVVGHGPQVEDGMSRFASDDKLLATWCGDLKLAGLVEQSLGEIVGSDRLI